MWRVGPRSSVVNCGGHKPINLVGRGCEPLSKSSGLIFCVFGPLDSHDPCDLRLYSWNMRFKNEDTNPRFMVTEIEWKGEHWGNLKVHPDCCVLFGDLPKAIGASLFTKLTPKRYRHESWTLRLECSGGPCHLQLLWPLPKPRWKGRDRKECVLVSQRT
jgi:hypothetical protein